MIEILVAMGIAMMEGAEYKAQWLAQQLASQPRVYQDAAVHNWLMPSMMRIAPVEPKATGPTMQIKAGSPGVDWRPTLEWKTQDTVSGMLAMQSTDGGGLKICYGDGTETIVEVLPDGRVVGDEIRALRMLAAVLAEQRKQAEKREK